MTKKKRKLICDIETNGLYNPDTIHCIVAEDFDTDEVFKFVDDSVLSDYKNLVDVQPVSKFTELLKETYEIVGHNFLSFDAPVLDDLLNTSLLSDNPECKILDTLVVSRLIFTQRNSQSLDAWGEDIGIKKPEHEDWSVFSKDMLRRCTKDVKINKVLYKILRAKASKQKFSKLSVDIEHESQKILNKQQKYGFAFDRPKAIELYNKLSEVRDEFIDNIGKYFPPLPKPVKEVELRYKKDGSRSIVGLKSLGYDDPLKYVYGDHTRIEWQEFNLRSPSQINDRMDRCGWDPYIKTDSGNSYKICEENLKTLPDTAPQAAHKLVEWRILDNRCKLLEEWIEISASDGRLHGQVLSIGAVTHRMSHRSPQTANIPSTRSEYGGELRELWTVTDTSKYSLLGADASGIQLRVLAHYMNDPEYTEAVQGDIHSYNAEVIGVSRSEAKTFIYAWALNASPNKLGKIVGGGYKEGLALDRKFKEAMPAAGKLKQKAEMIADRAGFYRAIDGRLIPMKSAHFALSAMLQGAESIIMKQVMIWLDDYLKKNWPDARQVGIIHDEFQLEVPRKSTTIVKKFKTEEEADIWSSPQGKVFSSTRPLDNYYFKCYNEIGEKITHLFRDTTEFFNLRCPMDGEYQVGNNWKDTH